MLKLRMLTFRNRLLTSGMIVKESGFYQSLDESFKIYLNKGEKVPQKENEPQTLKLIK